MLVGSHNGAVDEDLLEVGIARKRSKYGMPHLRARPSGKAFIHAVPSSEISRQITPWAAGASNPQHRFDKLSMSAAVRPASVALPGSSWAIRAYWSSLSINLGILNFRKRQDVNRFLQKLTAPDRMIVNTP